MRSRKDRTQTPGHRQRSAVPTPEQTRSALLKSDPKKLPKGDSSREI